MTTIKRVFHFILNESAAKQLGWAPEEAVGKKMFLDDSAGICQRGSKGFSFSVAARPDQKDIYYFPPNGAQSYW